MIGLHKVCAILPQDVAGISTILSRLPLAVFKENEILNQTKFTLFPFNESKFFC